MDHDPSDVPYRLVSRARRPTGTVVQLANGAAFGGGEVVIIAGPCAVESEAQLMAAAHAVKRAGGTVLRGGAFKPRTSPYSFQGLGRAGLELLSLARAETGLAVVTEAVDQRSADLVAEHADVIQIGARNMQSFELLKHVGRLKKPVLLKRGLSATLRELLLAAEYVVGEGNEAVILCERGVRGFDDATRNVLDVVAIPALRHLSHLPVIADPSHATGRRELVLPAARAAVAAGADGVMIEVHPEPELALSDGLESLYPAQLEELVREVGRVADAVDRRLARLAARPPA